MGDPAAQRPSPQGKAGPALAIAVYCRAVERAKAGLRAKVGHPPSSCGSSATPRCYRGLIENTAQMVALFALSNLSMGWRRLMGAQG
jgi:hypothetical protein